jgi:hypothetical protein
MELRGNPVAGCRSVPCMPTDRRTVRICCFPAAALPTRVKTIKFGDKTKVKRIDTEGLVFPLVSIQKVTIISATQLQDWCCLTACAYFRSSFVYY